MNRHSTRRQFMVDALLAGAVTSLPARAAEVAAKPASPNERLGMALVGAGGRGIGHLPSLLSLGDVDVTAICDVDKRNAEAAAAVVERRTGRKPTIYRDYRVLMEDKSVQAISFATPNHWHSLGAFWAMLAGKDAYVEKPISHCVWEGRKLIETSAKLNRVLTQGSQRRSWPSHIAAIEYLHSGALGKIKRVHGVCYKPRGSIGKTPNEPAPQGVDYDLWLGPAPVRPFSKNRFHYNWHWHWDTGDGDLGNTGVHDMDIIVWATRRSDLPRRAVSIGGRFGYEDDGETPNTQVVGLEYPDLTITYEVRGLPTQPHRGLRIGSIFYCENGSLAVGLDGVAAFDGNGEKVKDFGGRAEDGPHFRNFVDAVKRRDPSAVRVTPLQAHLGSSFCHLPNISYRLGRKEAFSAKNPFGEFDLGAELFENFQEHLGSNNVPIDRSLFVRGRTLTVDPATERIRDDDEANGYLKINHRAPYTFTERA